MTAVVTEAFRIHPRDNLGRGAARATRLEGNVPAILYGADKDNVSFSVDRRDIEKGLHSSGFYTRIYDIKVDGKAERAMVREVQFHPVNDRPIHIDFMRVKKGAKIHLHVPVTFINEDQCPGVKAGGVLNIVLHELDVACSVDNIPESIVVDLSTLELGHSVHTSDVDLGKGVHATHPERDNTLATLVAPTIQKVEQEDASAAAAEAEAASDDKSDADA